MNTQPHDPETGEIIEGEIVQGERAADGGIVPYAAGTAGELLNMIEDGQLSVDIIEESKVLVQRMMELAEATGNKQKGKMVITLNFATEGGPFTVEGSYKITPPKETRRRTTLFVDERNMLSRTQPRQNQMFGLRQVGGHQGIRRVD